MSSTVMIGVAITARSMSDTADTFEFIIGETNSPSRVVAISTRSKISGDTPNNGLPRSMGLLQILDFASKNVSGDGILIIVT